jgi:hypothetical protein
MSTIPGTILLKRGEEANLPTLAAGEPAFTTDSHKLFVGDGSTNHEIGGTGGTVTSIDVSGGTTGLTFSGGPVTSSGTITMAGTLAVANGGTGATSLTAYNVLVGNGTSAVAAVAPSTAGHVLTDNGASANPSFRALPTDSNGYDEAALNTNLDSSPDTWTDTGAEFTAPSTGDYLVAATVRYGLGLSSGMAAIRCRLYNFTDSAVVTGSEFQPVQVDDTVKRLGTSSHTFVAALTSGKNYRLQAVAADLVSASLTGADVTSDSDGRTAISYVKLSD